MVKQLFWLGAGIAVGVLVVRKVNQTVQAYSPSSLAGSARESAVGLFDTVKDFVADVREGMAQREAEINEAFEQGRMFEPGVMLDEEFDEPEDWGTPNGRTQGRADGVGNRG